MRARRLQRPNPGSPSVPFLRDWGGNRGEGPFALAGKHKVSQGYSPADDNAGLAYALRDDAL
jgi:hypothetical protein